MTERASFLRKLAYLGAIIVLAFPIVWLSVPATPTKEGGKLAQLRKQYKLSQVNLGNIDPASETIKLATLGLKGVAVNWLWEKANYYKKVEDWTNLTATLEQLAKLQPNFITFWKFQAWNLTYNVSVEFDDYRDRYYYVRRGIEFLQEGEQYNVDNPQLLWDLGWFVGQKIGRADEYLQYRRLFKNDDDYHPADRKFEDRDNWLVGKEWYLKAIDAVDNKGKSLGRKSQRDFYSSPAKSTMNYAEAIEEEGVFQRARRAWVQAAQEWRDFGNIFIEHSTGVKLQLGSQPRLEKEVAELRAKLEAMLPGVKDKILGEKKQALTAEERAVLDIPKDKLTPEQSELLYKVNEKLHIADREIGNRVAKEQPANTNQAMQLTSEIERLAMQLLFTINYKHDANYDYWQTRADFEQTANALSTRELMFQAKKEFRNVNLPKAKQLYEEGFAKWRQVIDEFPSILDEDQVTGEDILDFVKGYRRVLEQLDERLGPSFPLWDIVEKFDREREFEEELKEHRGESTPASAPEPADATPAAAAPSPDSKPAVEETKPESNEGSKAATDSAPAETSKLKPAEPPADDK